MARIDLVEWVKRFRKPLVKWFSKRGVGGDSEDLAQEVFIRLIRYGDEENIRIPDAYIFRIAANIASERGERCRVRDPHSDDDLEIVPENDELEPENILHKECLSRLVEEMIAKLPERQCTVVRLFIYERLTYKQIALRLGITPRTVLREITKAYTQLRAWIGPILSEVIDCEYAAERTCDPSGSHSGADADDAGADDILRAESA